jgi:predicted double-glycine peptidase
MNALATAAILITAHGASLDVPFVRQYKNGCGAASVAMVMQYWINQGAGLSREAADPSEIYRILYDPGVRGSAGPAMVAYLRDRAFSAFAIGADWSDVGENVSRGRPVIVCLRPSAKAPLHFVVVIGVEPEARKIVLHDPARGAAVAMDPASFDAAWRRAGNLALIATPGHVP